MSSHSQPRVLSFKADAAISYGQPVKIGTDKEHVAKVSAASDKAIGVCMSKDVTTAGDTVEVAINGGGGKGLAGGNIAAGDQLGFNASAQVVKVASDGDRVIGIAMESAVSGDVFSLEVVIGRAPAAQA